MTSPQAPPGLYVGSSGYSYPSWRPGFYPAGTRPTEFLPFYSARLPSVELNGTFYKLPVPEQLAAWGAGVPDGFRFAVKMTRRIVHGGQYGLIDTFCKRLEALGDRLGPVLVQLPPEGPRDDELLERFLGLLDPRYRYAFDLRDPSWAGVAPILDAAGAALVGSLDGAAPFRYVRFRDPPYDDEQLAAWAARLRPLLDSGIEVYCYFRHEDEPTAPAYATRLAELVAG